MLNNKIINPTVSEQDLPKQTLTKEEDSLLKRIQELISEQPVTPKQAQSVYPQATLVSRPNIDTSLAAQVKRQFKQGYARHISNNVYRLTLSKNTTVLDKSELDLKLQSLGLSSQDIQYIEQNNHNIVVNLTVPINLVTKWKEEK